MALTASMRSPTSRSLRSRAGIDANCERASGGVDNSAPVRSGTVAFAPAAGAEFEMVESATLVPFAKEIPSRIIELATILVGGAGEELEERVQASVEGPTQLRNGPIDRMQRQTGRFPCRGRETHLLGVGQRAFRYESQSIHQCVSRHVSTIAAPVGFPTS